MIKNISNLGDAALYCDFGNEINKEINTNVISFFKTIQEQNIKGITNLAPSYNKLIISFDLDLINFSDLKCLEIFGRDGTWHVSIFAKLVKSMEICL